MNTNTAYQPAGTTTVVVVNSNRPRGPVFLQQGVRVGGMALGMGCVVCLGLFGGFFIFSSVIMLATANYDDDFWDDFDRDNDPVVVVGSIFLTIGIILVAAAVGMCVFAHRKYKRFQADGVTTQGRVISPPPGSQQTQPLNAGYPAQPQPAPYPGHPQPFGFAQHQPAAYGQPQPYGYQPQPSGYPPQHPFTSAPTSAYPGPPASYPEPSGGYAVQADPSYPQKTSVTNVTSEYDPPPPTAPNASSQPPPYQP